MRSAEIQKNADRLLCEWGLMDILKDYGTPHIIGSCRMGMMAWNDLDIDIENDAVSTGRLYSLTAKILDRFRPTWYEAKEETRPDGSTVWFHGFETRVTGEVWNVDLWFFDRDTIRQAEAYCDRIAQNTTPEQKEAIIRMKTDLISRGLYAFDRYKSMDVYRAVTEEGIYDADTLIARHPL